MSLFQSNAIFWVEVDKIKPNPYQPRREFDLERLRDLAESIRQYGVLQPLTVTRREVITEDGGIYVEYELIAGERRHRASKLAGLTQVPVIIRTGEENSQLKLELAIIENLQREDINAIERAKAFAQLAQEFNLKHVEIAKKVGKSREYVSNTIRLLALPEEMQQAIMEGKLSEGHARPILMLNDRPEEQMTLYKEVVLKKLTVREAEQIARRIAQDKVRKRAPDPMLVELEKQLSESLGTRVQIEQREVGGKIVIDYFSPDDVRSIIKMFESVSSEHSNDLEYLEKTFASQEKQQEPQDVVFEPDIREMPLVEEVHTVIIETPVVEVKEAPEAREEDEEDLYSISNFSI